MLTTFNELAEAELNDAVRYYENEQPGLGLAFLAEIRRTTAAVAEHPAANPILVGTIRRSEERNLRLSARLTIEVAVHTTKDAGRLGNRILREADVQ